MRQIHNNGTSGSKERDKLTGYLTSAGFSPANIAWLVPYLDPSQPEDPERLKQAQKQSVQTLTQEQRRHFAFLLRKLLEQENRASNLPATDQQKRAVKAFFAIMGPSMMHTSISRGQPWLDILKNLDNLRLPLDTLLGPGATLALYANGWSGESYRANRLKQARPETIESALTYCTDPADPARIVLACLWLAKQGGIITSLMNNGKKKEMLETVREGAAALLPEAAPSLNPADRNVLINYMKQEDESPLPVKKSLRNATALGARSFDTAAVGSACFLAMGAVPALQPVFIVYAALDPLTLQYSLELEGVLPFQSKIPWLIEHTPFAAVIPRLCAYSYYQSIAQEIARQYPEQFEKALAGLDYINGQHVLKVFQAANPERARRFQENQRPGRQKEIANTILDTSDGFTAAEVADLQRFILSGGDLSGFLAKFPLYAAGGKGYSYARNFRISNYAGEFGLDPFLARCIIVLAFCKRTFAVANTWNQAYKKLPKEQQHMGTLLDAVAKEGLPLESCLLLSEWEDAHSYSQKDKEEIAGQTVDWMLNQPESLLSQVAEKGSAYARTLAVQALAKKGDFDALLLLAGDSSKQVRKAVEDAFATRPFDEGPKAALELLQSKKAGPRETGIRILMNLEGRSEKKGAYTQQYRAQLEDALSKEKSAKLANALRGLLGLELVKTDGRENAAGTPSSDPVADVLKGGRKRKVQWVLDGTQTLPGRAPGGALAESEDRLAAVMVCCMQPGGLAEAKKLAEPLDARELAEFAGAVFNLWLEQNAPSKQKWVLTFSAVFGGHAMVDNLKRQINQWPQDARGAIACEAVNALALSPEPEALLLVDGISRKFKFKQVKAAAGKALDFAAKELGVSTEELADRIVPDLGLDQRGQRVFNYGPRSFTVTLTPALELEIQNQDGKKIKSMPAPGKQDDPVLAGEASAGFKALKKQIKATVSTQTLRLEQALSTGRIWTGAGWRELFVQKPIMRQFAVGLIWGVYGAHGTVSDTFRYLEDGSLNTVDEDEYELADDARVGLVHPVELSQEALDAWKQQLEDYEIKQPIEQLTRPVSRVAEDEKDKTSLDTFGGRVLNDLALSGKLLGMGWYRGSVLDAGGFYDFYREDGPIGAQLNFSGSFVGGGFDSEATVYDIQFYRSGTVQRGSYVYDVLGNPEPGTAGTNFVLAGRTSIDNRLIKLGEVPARLFSEIVYQVQKATASSTETRDDWKTNR